MEHDISVKEQSIASSPLWSSCGAPGLTGLSRCCVESSHMAPKLEGTIRDFQLHVSDGFLCVWVLLHRPSPEDRGSRPVSPDPRPAGHTVAAVSMNRAGVSCLFLLSLGSRERKRGTANTAIWQELLLSSSLKYTTELPYKITFQCNRYALMSGIQLFYQMALRVPGAQQRGG